MDRWHRLVDWLHDGKEDVESDVERLDKVHMDVAVQKPLTSTKQ